MIDHKDLLENPSICFEQLLNDDSPLKYLYGPLLAMSNNFENYKLSWSSNPLMKAFVDIASLIKCIESKSQTIANIKSFIISYISANKRFANDCWQANACINTYQKVLDSIRATQYKDNLLESAMIDYAPIVNYSQTVKAPMMEDDSNDVQVMLTNTISSDSKTFSTDMLDEILKNNIFSIVRNSLDSVRSIVPFSDADFFSLYNSRNYDKELYGATMYYLIAYIINKIDTSGVSTLLTSLKAMDKANQSIAEEKFDTQAMINILGDVSLEADLDIPEHMEFQSDKEIASLMNDVDINDDGLSNVEKNYDIYKLTDYIYTARRYMYNKYTNSLFLSSHKQFNDCSYLKDNLLVAEIDEQYLCSPVIDLADDYKTKLIRLDKDGQISIIPLI